MKFYPGNIVITPGAEAALAKDKTDPRELLLRHLNGDWGEMPEEDVKQNEFCLVNGGMLMSCYRTPTSNERIWCISEHDRSCTTILLPEEY